ncbi:hypothetical protein RCL_jg3918.t1 [Rhizophagus clarus]|uniref:Uncharacterized protein n=1 Tax=Rhizophagus clarus TaxID=94130 RepID=A0A8H3QDR7_9GLOM|nr:hypothetical protein RCL_jg3918.t1 [Rhizophagus clarus]
MKETGASKGSYRESIDSSFSTYGYCINTQRVFQEKKNVNSYFGEKKSLPDLMTVDEYNCLTRLFQCG